MPEGAAGSSAAGRALHVRILAALDSRWFLPVVLGVGLVVRLLWIWWAWGAGVRPVSDAAWYYERGLGIAAGGGYMVDGIPTAYWPVGYPGFLGLLFSIVGDAIPAAMVANALLYVAGLPAIYLIARRMFDSARTGAIAVAILALYPNHIAYSSQLLSEPLFFFLLFWGMAVMLTKRKSLIRELLTGTLFGAAALVKPQALFVPALCWLALRFERGANGSRSMGWRSLMAIHAMMLLALLPWSLRNYRLFGHHGVLSTNDGINLLIGNNPLADGGYRLEPETERLYHGAPDEYQRNRAARDHALRYIAANPLEATARLPVKLWKLYRADTEGFSMNARELPPGSPAERTMSVLKLAAQGAWVLLIGCFLGALYLLRGRIPAPGLWIVLYFTAIPLVFFGDGRFHFPVLPWLALYGAMLPAHLLEKRSTELPRR